MVDFELGDHAAFGECEDLLEAGAHPDRADLVVVGQPHIVLIWHELLRVIQDGPQVLVDAAEVGPHQQNPELLAQGQSSRELRVIDEPNILALALESAGRLLLEVVVVVDLDLLVRAYDQVVAVCVRDLFWLQLYLLHFFVLAVVLEVAVDVLFGL